MGRRGGIHHSQLLFCALLITAVGNATGQENPNGKDNDKNASGGASAATPSPAPAPVLIPPVLVRGADPVYPEQAKSEGLQAEVVLELDVDIDGRVEGVVVAVPASPAGYGFDEAAVDAAWLLEFTPATEDGVPVPVRLTYRFGFALDAPAAEAPTSEEIDASAPAAGAVNLRGQLLERGTRKKVVGATVVVVQEGDGETAAFENITDKEGIFEFISLPPGRWKVISDPEGYYPLRTVETVVAGERTVVKYYIEKQSYNPFDVLVEGTQPRKEVNRVTISVQEIDKIPGTFGDVLGVVQNLPGVARSGIGPGQIVVRGSSPEDTQVFVDGITVPIIYHFGGLRSVIPLGMLQKLDFYPGNFSTYYGRAIGGILDVQTKRLAPERPGGYLDINVFDTSLFAEVPIGKKASIALAGRRSYIDGILSFAVPDDAQVNLITAPRYYDWQFLASYRPTPAHELTFFIFGSDDNLKLLFENPAEFNPQLTTGRLSTSTTFYRSLIEYRYVPNDKFENTLKLGQGRNWLDLSLGEQLFFNINNYNSQIRDTARVKLGEQFTLITGVDYLFNKSDVDILLPPVIKEGEAGAPPDLDDAIATSADDRDYHSVGIFLETELTFFERLLIIPGLRLDYFSRVGETSLDPRLTVRYELNDKLALKGGVGLFHQEPQFDETNADFGNPDLGLESAIHYSLGSEFKPMPHITLDTTVFYKDMNDLVSPTDDLVERDGEIVPQNFNNEGTGRVYGFELLARHEFHKNFYGWVSYTLSRAERRDSGSDDYRLFDFDQTHILAVLGSYRLPRNWEIGFRWRFVTGKPETPVEDAVYDVDDARYNPIRGEANSTRIPAFHQLDLRVDKRWIFNAWIFSAYLDIQNVYNRANAEGFSYNFDYTERDVTQSLPIIPVLGLKGEF